MKKNYYIIVFFLFVLICTKLKSQNFQWADGIGSPGDDVCYSVVSDQFNNNYSTGIFFGTADFDPGPSVYNLISNGDQDIFIAKYDNLGNLIWAKDIGSFGHDISRSIAIDVNGNIYITGGFTGTVDFDPGTGVANLTSPQYEDIFFAKYDNDGNYLWAKSFGGPEYTDFSYEIAVDGFSNCYITGGYSNTADFDPGPGIFNLVSNGAYDVFFAKYNMNGDLIWAKSVGASTYDRSFSLALDQQNNVYITGEFGYTVDFDPGPGVANLTGDGGDFFDAIFFAKYDSSGNYVWAKSISSSQPTSASNIEISDSGNVYLAGYFGATMSFNPTSGYYLTPLGGYDCFFAKYDNNGNFIWAKNFGSSDYDYCKCFTLDKFENIYLTGSFSGICDFDPEPQVLKTITSVGNADIFFAKYDSNGEYIFAKGIGSIGDDQGNSIVLSPNFPKDIYVAGYFSSLADFDCGVDTFNIYSLGGTDIFILKYDTLNVVGYEKFNANYNFIVFPNPSNGSFSIDIDQCSNIIEIKLTDLVGNIVLQRQTNKQTKFTIDNLQGGTFILTLIDKDSKMINKKIISCP